MTEEKLTFWEHLDELRVVLIRIVIVLAAVTVIAFAFKEPLFKIILAPHKADFILYRLINRLSSLLAWPQMSLPEFEVKLISTELTAQFFTHMKVAFFAALLVSSPYVVFILFRFINSKCRQPGFIGGNQ
jgi:sec-independent protein translocase protein TatC